ncbi:hypothetical protein [Streptomyces sp. NPDC002537]
MSGANGWVRAGRTGLAACAVALATAAAAPTADADPDPSRPPMVRVTEGGPGDGGPSAVIDDGRHRQVRVSGSGTGPSVVIRGPGCVTVTAHDGISSAVVGPRCPVPPSAVPPWSPAPGPPAAHAPRPPRHVPPPPPAPVPRPAPPKKAAPAPPPELPAPPSPPPAPAPVASPTPHVAVRTYHQTAVKPPRGGSSLVTLTLVLTAPAVLAAALLRPRGGGGSRN